VNDEKLINAIKNGDETAIAQAMDKYARLLWSVVSAVLKNVAPEQDMEECVADVFISLWQNPEKYDAGRGGLRTWLCIKARSRALDRYREISRRSALPLPADPACGTARNNAGKELLPYCFQSLSLRPSDILLYT